MARNLLFTTLLLVAVLTTACTTTRSLIYDPDNTQGNLVADGDLTVVSKETVTITTYDAAGNPTGTQTTEKVVQSAKSQAAGKLELGLAKEHRKEEVGKTNPCHWFWGCPRVHPYAGYIGGGAGTVNRYGSGGNW